MSHGALYEVTAALSRAGANIENASGFPVSGGEAVLIPQVADVPRAERLLGEAGLRCCRRRRSRRRWEGHDCAGSRDLLVRPR